MERRSEAVKTPDVLAPDLDGRLSQHLGIALNTNRSLKVVAALLLRHFLYS
jgi:hypothetical protein